MLARITLNIQSLFRPLSWRDARATGVATLTVTAAKVQAILPSWIVGGWLSQWSQPAWLEEARWSRKASPRNRSAGNSYISC